MGKSRNRWQTLKSEMQAVGVKTSLFAQDLGSKLDGFDAAIANYDQATTKLERSDPKVQLLAKTVRQACSDLLPVAASYEQQLDYLAKNATDPRQRQPLAQAQGWLMSVIETIRQLQPKLPE